MAGLPLACQSRKERMWKRERVVGTSVALSTNPWLSFFLWFRWHLPWFWALSLPLRIYTSGSKVGKGTVDEWMERKGSFEFLRAVGVRCTWVQVRRWTCGSHGLPLAMAWPKWCHRKCNLVVPLAFCIRKET